MLRNATVMVNALKNFPSNKYRRSVSIYLIASLVVMASDTKVAQAGCIDYFNRLIGLFSTSPQTYDRKVVLVTGAATGIGLALAKELIAQEGKYIVVMAARKAKQRFAELGFEESEHIFIRELDVLNEQDQINLLDDIQLLGGVDVLINNAGVSPQVTLEQATKADLLSPIKTNYIAPMLLIQKILPGMRKKRRGTIINISSPADFMAAPTAGGYVGSRHALRGLSEVVYQEVKQWGISVTLAELGFVDTGVHAKALTDRARQALEDPNDPYYPVYKTMIHMLRLGSRLVPTTPESVAKTLVKALDRKRLPLAMRVTADAKVFYFLRRTLSDRAFYRVMDFMYWGAGLVNDGREAK